MKKTPYIFIALLFVLANASYSQSAGAAKINNVIISHTPQNILVSFDIKDGFTKEIEDAIKSGIPTAFTFIVEFYRERSIWFDEKLAEVKFRHTVKYDTMKAEYEVLLEEKAQSNKIIRLKDLSKVKELMTKAEIIQVSSPAAIQKGSMYGVKIKAKLDAVELFFPLNYMLFFVSFWDFETDWHEETIVF